MSEYNQKLLEHFLNPRNVGVIKNPDGYARVENPVNGYTTDMYLRVENGRIQDIKFRTYGCTVTIASASALTNLVKGKTLEEIADSGNSLETLLELMRGELGEVPERNWHCLPIAIQTLYSAVYDYYKKGEDEKNVKKMEDILANIKCYFENKLSQLEV
jgi:nitrogen fixation NifU-like protein